jgi:hypothetical protein
MRTHYANLVQIVLSLILVAAAIVTPTIRIFLFNHLQWVIIGICITGILYVQVLKVIYGEGKRLKAKIKNQSQLIDTLLISGSLQGRILKDIVIPEMFERNADEFISKLHESGISTAELINFGIDRKIIAHYELYYYIGKAKEQQELLNAHKKANTDEPMISNAPVIKEITGGEAESATYPLRTVSAG